jgi:hypothetical protein
MTNNKIKISPFASLLDYIDSCTGSILYRYCKFKSAFLQFHGMIMIRSFCGPGLAYKLLIADVKIGSLVI